MYRADRDVVTFSTYPTPTLIRFIPLSARTSYVCFPYRATLSLADRDVLPLSAHQYLKHNLLESIRSLVSRELRMSFSLIALRFHSLTMVASDFPSTNFVSIHLAPSTHSADHDTPFSANGLLAQPVHLLEATPGLVRLVRIHGRTS